MVKSIPRRKAKRKIYIESAFVVFIAISPFLYKLYDYLPDNPEATITFLGFTIDNNGFHDISTYAWFMMSKIVPLYLLFLWFLTSRNWWYHIILIPIAMYAFQVFEVLFDSDNTIDTDNIWWLLPICMVVIPFVYFIRIKLYDKYVHGIDLEAMEAELEAIKKKQENRLSVERENKMESANSRKNNSYEYRTLSERLEYGLSTQNIENYFKRFIESLRSLLHLRF
jgi:hypothetical protein